jgi:VanZ family protein
LNKDGSVYIRNAVLWVLAIVYYIVINTFSVTPAAVSRAESQSVINAVEKVTEAVQHKSESKGFLGLSDKAFHKLVRKTAHVINFFILAFLHCMLFFSYSREKLITVLLALFVGLCGAALDEMTQFFVAGRSAQISDVLIDFVGTIFGCVFFVWLYCKTLSE